MNHKREVNKKIIIAFDVDGTLIKDSDDTPRYRIIQLFQNLESLGCRMVIASGGGVEYASRWAEKLGLKAEIWAKDQLQDAHIVFDDETICLGKVGIYV